MFTLFKLLGNKRLFILLLGLILFIALMGFTLGARGKLTWAEKFVHDTTSFVQQMFYRPAAAVSAFFDDVANLSETYKENEQLKVALAHYIRDKAEYNDIKAENERYKELLKFTEHQLAQNSPNDYRIAQVTGINVADPFNQTLNINLGKKNGIKEGMPVIAVDGLVGVVSHVSEFSSSVQLITNIDDKSRAISVTVQGKENKSFGMIESYDHSNNTFLMTRIEEEDPLEENDIVVSSGLGGKFPAGLIIGKVKKRQVGDIGLTHTATIEPAANYRDWRELIVVVPPESDAASQENGQ